MSTNADDPLRAELADIRAAAEHALGVCDPEASVATLVDLLATEHRNLQARLVERVASIVAFLNAEAQRFELASYDFNKTGKHEAAERCHVKAGRTRALATQIARGDDLRGDK